MKFLDDLMFNVLILIWAILLIFIVTNNVVVFTFQQIPYVMK